MEPSDALDLISNTYGDRLHVLAVFLAAGDQSLRLELAIDGDFFRAVFQRNDGSVLNIIPGNVIAQTSDGKIQSVLADTQAALAAWKGQPPITFAPVAAGLGQLGTGNPTIDAIIAQLSQFNGTLAFGFLPDVCWYQSSYAKILLPGIDLEGVTGRLCLRDITFNTTTLSFIVELRARETITWSSFSNVEV